jgi:hypothetical protein
MKANIYNMRNAAREERKRQIAAAGLVSGCFPDVASIVVTMNYSRGTFPSVLRTVNFYPGSQAFFRISCLGEGCDDGGLDLSGVMQRMIKRHEKSAKGVLHCENRDEAIVHPSVDYEVAITYA